MFFFVYGTLKQGHGNHRLMASGVESIDNARVEGFTLHGDGIPYAVEADGARVRGELIRLRDDAAPLLMARLDQLEGHPTHYKRTLVVAVREHDGAEIPCWMYVSQRAWGRHLGESWPAPRPTNEPLDLDAALRAAEDDYVSGPSYEIVDGEGD